MRCDAKAARQAGDPRRPSAQIADLALDRLLRAASPGVDDAGSGAADGYTVELQVVISLAGLLGLDDEPAHLDGHGPIPADLARQLASGHATWVRQLLTDPGDGRLLRISRRRAFPDDMRSFLLARTRGACAIEACTRQASDIDHLREHHDGGPTSIANGQALCASHNDLKSKAGIRCVSRGSDDAVVWIFPGGQRRTQHPPPPLGPGSGPTPVWEDPDDCPF